MAAVTIDTSVLVAADRNERRAWQLKAVALRRGHEIHVPAPVLAQAWRGPRNANLARFLRGCVVVALDEDRARETGELCGTAGTDDIIDASLVVTAGRGGIVVTGDPGDVRRLASKVDGVDVREL